MDHSRHYDNDLPDYPNPNSALVINANTNEIHDDFKQMLSTSIKKLLTALEDNRKHWNYHDDCSVYTGTTGIAYMFYKYGKTFDEPAYITKASEMLRACVSKFRGKREITFLTGMMGPLSLNAIVAHSLGNREETDHMISKAKALSVHVLDEGGDLPDELLYGKAGYLFSLLLLNANISPPPIEDNLIRQVIAQILKSGNIYAASSKYKTPIMYAWHNSEYLGGAHGLGGILYILLQARQYLTQSQLDNEIKPALEFLHKLQYPSGNFPSSIGSHSDKLVHWCHGAPGMTMLYLLASEVFQDDGYFEIADQCGDVVWNRGLLRKGYSICHGVSGNAYTFLCLFQRTKNVKYLYRACKFADWCTEYGKRQNGTPDRPFSLFEGLAGTLYFLIDMQHPNSAKFPAYTV